MQKNESNIIRFQKKPKNIAKNQREEKEKSIYDSLFTRELHKELLAQARKDHGQ